MRVEKLIFSQSLPAGRPGRDGRQGSIFEDQHAHKLTKSSLRRYTIFFLQLASSSTMLMMMVLPIASLLCKSQQQQPLLDSSTHTAARSVLR